MFFIYRTLSYIILYSTQFRGKITQQSKAYTTHTYINIILYGHVSDEKGIQSTHRHVDVFIPTAEKSKFSPRCQISIA